MKIERVLADNFLRLNLLELDLTSAAAHLIAGRNEAGKSSIQEAIRFALLGETVRVTRKGDYKLMIRDGAKSGTVSVTVDGVTVTRDVKTGKEADEDYPYHAHDFLHFLLDAQRFAKEKPEARREILFALTGTSITGDDIQRRAVAKGCDAERFEQVKPMLRTGGFTAAHKEAEARAAEARARWCGLTGAQRYGSKIAETWTMQIPEDWDEEKYQAMEFAIERKLEKMANLNEERGRVSARILEVQRVLERHAQAEGFDEEELECLEIDIADLREEIDEIRTKQADIMEQVRENERPLVTCPHCQAEFGVQVTVEQEGGLIKVAAAPASLSPEEIQRLKAEYANLGAKASLLTTELQEKTGERRRLIEAKSAALSADPDYTEEDLEKLVAEKEELDKKAAETHQTVLQMQGEIADLRVIAERIRSADEINAKAREYHQDVVEWKKIVDALAPDGIPAEILSDTLKPVNDRLRDTAMATGWAQITIDPDMTIRADGRPYSLLSESAKWRADAAVAEAIAYLSDLKLLVLDRVDVLDLSSRAQLVRWIGIIAHEYDTILMFGTFKALPTGLPAGIAAYWLEDGEIAGTSEAA